MNPQAEITKGLRVALRSPIPDGNYHVAPGLNRRSKATVYLNPYWEPSWGGEFGVYDKAGEVRLKETAPLFNRLVFFDPHDFSFNGLPDPVAFPKGMPRRSIILCCYTKEPRPSEHVTVRDPRKCTLEKARPARKARPEAPDVPLRHSKAIDPRPPYMRPAP